MFKLHFAETQEKLTEGIKPDAGVTVQMLREQREQ